MGVKLPSGIQALDLQSLPCEVGVYMVVVVSTWCLQTGLWAHEPGPHLRSSPGCWPVTCVGMQRARALAGVVGQLCPRALRPSLMAAWALCLGWRLAAGQPSAHSAALYTGLLTCVGWGVRRHRCRMGPFWHT